MNILVGYTGFVGSNIYAKGKFDAVYNSKNIEQAYGTNPDLLIYSGLRAEKYLANNNPQKDYALIEDAQNNIQKINPKKLVLISTIDVFKNPQNVDENSVIDTDGLQAYGLNRYKLELWVREHYKDALIIRLPGLFGKNIKKNFIFDCINLIPTMLKVEKFNELKAQDPNLEKYYNLQDNGFYKVNVVESDKDYLKSVFKRLGFSALNFTDSRSKYQFYDLSRLWDDIQICIQNGITLWHPATEPVSAGEIYQHLYHHEFINELKGIPANYNYKTIHSALFNDKVCKDNNNFKDDYICSKSTLMQQIKAFVKSYS